MKISDRNITIKLPNVWDIVAFLLVMGSRQMAVPNTPGEQIPLSLAPAHLPMYALRTVLRMVAALIASLALTFTYATEVWLSEMELL